MSSRTVNGNGPGTPQASITATMLRMLPAAASIRGKASRTIVASVAFRAGESPTSTWIPLTDPSHGLATRNESERDSTRASKRRARASAGGSARSDSAGRRLAASARAVARRSSRAAKSCFLASNSTRASKPSSYSACQRWKSLRPRSTVCPRCCRAASRTACESLLGALAVMSSARSRNAEISSSRSARDSCNPRSSHVNKASPAPTRSPTLAAIPSTRPRRLVRITPSSVATARPASRTCWVGGESGAGGRAHSAVAHRISSQEPAIAKIAATIPNLAADTPFLGRSQPMSRLSQIGSTRRFTLSSIAITSGHGRVNPSLGSLRVASMPIFDPKFGNRLA